MSKSRVDFVIEESTEGRTLVVTGRWSREAENAIVAGDADGLNLNYARGFCEGDLSFLGSWPVRRLDVLDRSIGSLEPIARLARSLEHLSVQAAPDARLDLGVTPKLRYLAGEWPLLRPTLEAVSSSLCCLTTWKFDESNLLPLVEQSQLENLTVKDAGRLETLDGVSALSKLSVLGIHMARGLTDISALRYPPPSLRELRFEYCSKLSRLDDLSTQTQLHHLGINDCRIIESLLPLRGLTELEVFHAWGPHVD